MAVDLDEPRYDQSSYWGRARHYLDTTNPLNLLVTETRLHQYKVLLERYREGHIQAGLNISTTIHIYQHTNIHRYIHTYIQHTTYIIYQDIIPTVYQDVSPEDLWRAKTICQSAFHPDTGELMFLPGRMAAQVSLRII